MKPVGVFIRNKAQSTVPPGSGDTLVDRFGRVHRDLRISLTDACNLRCTYCLPEGTATFSKTSTHLSTAELLRAARVARALGIAHFRLTGGEPLLRSDVVDVVAGLAALEPDDLAMTTNAMLLTPLVADLASAGLTRVTVSCDSLRPERFASIRGRGELSVVLRAMDAAEAAGLGPVKVNVVVMRGVNDDEIVDFARFARHSGRVVRFIEFMPLDRNGAWQRDAVVSATEIKARIDAVFPLEAGERKGAPARPLAFRDGLGEIGIIASVTEPFCGDCDRLRLTAQGAIVNCLFSNDEFSLRDLIRAGATDDELGAVFHGAVGAKRAGHGIGEPGFAPPTRSMSEIGG